MRWVLAVAVSSWATGALAAPPIVEPTTVEVGEGGTVALDVLASDPDGDELAYLWDLDGDGAFDDSIESAPLWSAAGIDGPRLGIRVEVSVSDGGSSTLGWVDVDVLNVAPVFEPEGPIRIAVGREWSYVARVTDPGGDAVTTSVRGSLPEGAAFDDAAGVLTWTPEEPQLGAHDILLRADDDDGGSSLHEIRITVVEDTPPPAPSLSAVLTEDIATVTLSHVDDPDGDDVFVVVSLDTDPCFCGPEYQSSGELEQGPMSTVWQTPRPLDVVNHQTFYLHHWASDGMLNSEVQLTLLEVPQPEPEPEPEDDWGDDEVYSCPSGGCCGGDAVCRVAGRHETRAPLAAFLSAFVLVLVLARARRRKERYEAGPGRGHPSHRV